MAASPYRYAVTILDVNRSVSRHDAPDGQPRLHNNLYVFRRVKEVMQTLEILLGEARGRGDSPSEEEPIRILFKDGETDSGVQDGSSWPEVQRRLLRNLLDEKWATIGVSQASWKGGVFMTFACLRASGSAEVEECPGAGGSWTGVVHEIESPDGSVYALAGVYPDRSAALAGAARDSPVFDADQCGEECSARCLGTLEQMRAIPPEDEPALALIGNLKDESQVRLFVYPPSNTQWCTE